MAVVQSAVILFCLIFLINPTAAVELVAVVCATLVRSWINLLWQGMMTFWSALDLGSTEPGLVVREAYAYGEAYLHDPWFQMYVLRSLFLHYFDPVQYLAGGGALAARFRPLHVVGFRRIQHNIRRYVVDSGATHHLSYRLLADDKDGPETRVNTALGGSGIVRFSAKGHCILDPAEPGQPKADELLSLPCLNEEGCSFSWPCGRPPVISHPALPAPVVCTVVERTPSVTMEQFDQLRSLTRCSASARLFDAAAFPVHDDAPLSLVLLGRRDCIFDAHQSWFSRAYLVQYSPSTLYGAWVRSERCPDVFLTMLAEVDKLWEADLAGGGPIHTPVDDYYPQVTFVQSLSLQRAEISFQPSRCLKAPKGFFPQKRAKCPRARAEIDDTVQETAEDSSNLPADLAVADDAVAEAEPSLAPASGDPFTQLAPAELELLDDELIARDDVANARRKGQMHFTDQERVVKLLERGRPLVSGDVAFPGNACLGMSCLWIFEILLLEELNGDREILRLVLPMPARSESLEDLRPLLLLIRHRLSCMEGGFEFRSEAEKATRSTEFKPWAAEYGITVDKSQDYRHPSYEVAVGQVERSLRKLHFQQSCPGVCLWAASAHYLLFRALRDAHPQFGARVSFAHKFPRDLFARICFSPVPGKKNPVCEQTGQPVILLYPRWTSSHTVIGLTHSAGSHQGLKTAEFQFSELKVTKALAFERDISSTLMIRHFLKQPFKRSLSKKAVLPRSVSCPACVRGQQSIHGKGRPPRHTCKDDCCMAERHIFQDTDYILTRDIDITARALRGEMVADIAVQAAQQLSLPVQELDEPVMVSPPGQGGHVAVRRATVDVTASPGLAASASGTDSVPSPVLRRLVEDANFMESSFKSIELRRLAGCESFPPDVTAVLVRQTQLDIRRELQKAVDVECNPGLRSDRVKNGQKANGHLIKIRTVSVVKAQPGMYAVTLVPREEAKKCETDEALLKEVHQSGDRELSNMLWNDSTGRATLRLTPVENVGPNDTVLPSLVVLTRKRDGRYKSRLVGCGNFDDSLSPDATYSSAADGAYWRLLLLICILLRWTVVGIDVSEAFTQADPKDAEGKRTFVKLPSQWKGILMPPLLRQKGVTESNYSKWVLEVCGWLYGERGAPRAWRQTLIQFLLTLGLGLTCSTYDPDILYATDPLSCLFVIVFVDDVWIFSQKSSVAHELIKLLRQRFKCTEPEWLCGRSSDEPWPVAIDPLTAPTFCAVSVYFSVYGGVLYLILSQTEFLEGAFKKLIDKGVVTEAELHMPLWQLDPKMFLYDNLNEDCPDNPLLSAKELTYLRAAVNTLSYAALRTKMELLPALGQCARGQSAKGRKRFLVAMIAVLRFAYTYRGRTINVDTGLKTDRGFDKLVVKPIADVTGLVFQQQAHFDASLGCAGTSQDGFARQGSHFFIVICGVVALWLSKCGLQSTYSLSTTESELTAATACARECVSTMNFLREIFPVSRHPSAKMYGDNCAANRIGACLASVRKVRHLSLAQLWIRRATSDNLVTLDYIPTKQNCADLLTKIVNREVLKDLLALLSIFDLSEPRAD